MSDPRAHLTQKTIYVLYGISSVARATQLVDGIVSCMRTERLGCRGKDNSLSAKTNSVAVGRLRPLETRNHQELGVRGPLARHNSNHGVQGPVASVALQRVAGHRAFPMSPDLVAPNQLRSGIGESGDSQNLLPRYVHQQGVAEASNVRL